MRTESRTLGHHGAVGVLYGALVALSYGVADFLGGLSSRRLHVAAVLTVGQLTGLFGVAAVMVAGGGFEDATSSDVVRGAAAGLATFVGLGLFFRGMARGTMSVVAPIAAVVSAVVPFAWAVAVSGERPGWAATLGVALAVGGVGVVASPGHGAIGHPPPIDVVLAAISGAGFGLVFILLGDTSDGSGLSPVLATRAVSGPLAVAWLVLHHRSTGWRPPPFEGLGPLAGILLAQGLLDASANALFLAAAHTGLLSEVAVVSALYPAPTVVLAAVVLGERPSRRQRAALAVVLVGVALIAT